MISKAPSHLTSKEDHKTVRTLYLETPEVMVSSVLATFTRAVADEVSTGRKFVRLGVLFTWNQANSAKILSPSRSQIRTLKPSQVFSRIGRKLNS